MSKFDLPIGTPLEKLETSPTLVQALRDLGIRDVECLYGMIAGTPDIVQSFVKPYGVNFAELRAKAETVLGSEKVAELSASEDSSYHLGAFDPKDSSYHLGAFDPKDRNPD